MKNRIISLALVLCLMAALLPASLAAETDVMQGADLGSVMKQTEEEGWVYVNLDEYDIPDGAARLRVTMDDDTAINYAMPEEMKEEQLGPLLYTSEDAEEQLDQRNNSSNTQTTTSFTTYGEQLSSVGLVFDDGTVVEGMGAAMTRMYRDCKEEIEKGEQSAYFTDDQEAIDKLALRLYISNASADPNAADVTEARRYYILRAICSLVYRSLDYDCPDMFYSSGSSTMAYINDESYQVIEVIPRYLRGYETLEQRQDIKNKLDDIVAQIIDECAQYTRAYDKMMYFHDWLCENNSYNHDAADNNDYYEEVSGDPWTTASALLSSSTDDIEAPVCEGYARAFQLLCRQVGITTALATGSNHMWNNARYGQYWTGIDVTWDDSNDVEGVYSYFCQEINNINGHYLDDAAFAALQYPALSVVDAGVLPFYDHMQEWQIPHVQYMYDNDYMAGKSCVDFGVNDAITRAQFAVILYNIAGRPEVEYTNRFSDVGDGTWYTSACLWAEQQGIASGYTDGRFGVRDYITREQIAQMLYNRSGDSSVRADLSQFTDADQIHDWAIDAMRWAVGYGVMSGNGNGILDPLGNATRAQTAAMLRNLLTKEA